MVEKKEKEKQKKKNERGKILQVDFAVALCVTRYSKLKTQDSKLRIQARLGQWMDGG